jgi:hypothetical protein
MTFSFPLFPLKPISNRGSLGAMAASANTQWNFGKLFPSELTSAARDILLGGALALHSNPSGS